VTRATKFIAATLVAALTAGVALAQATPEELAAAVEARHNHMKSYGAALGALGKMAKGEVAYDAAAAVAAADKLVELSSLDQSGFWLPGTGAIDDSDALPALFENLDDYATRTAALNAAAKAMQTAAATDLAALQAAMGPLGGACGSCHETYRKPD
jgi:cytochrome c556